MKKLSLYIFVILMVCSLAQALPKCEGDHHTKWVNCFGTVKKEISTSDKKIKRIANFTGEYGSTPGKRGGKGVSRVYENGIFISSYEGEWKDGKPHGQGTESQSSYVYEGGWKDGIKNGLGTFNKANGDIYVGELKDGKFNGQGTFSYAEGDSYVGEMKNGLFHGQGTFTFTDGSKYVGEFKEGKFVK